MSNALLWWGYLHTSDTIHLKRYFGPEDIKEAYESPFVRIIVQPFEASSSSEAREILEKNISKFKVS